jgi:mono/diheme cytochrome c family protein
MRACRMSSSLFGVVIGLIALLPCQHGVVAADKELAARAQNILKENCYKCHGGDPKKVAGDLNILAMGQLTDAARAIVVPKKPDASEMIRRIESTDNDVRMPPPPNKPLDDSSHKTLRDWIAAGAPPFAGEPPRAGTEKIQPKPSVVNPAELAARVKTLFRSRCFDCHGGTKTNAGIRILDYALLIEKKKKVIPGRPEASAVYRVITGTGTIVMPPPGNPRLGETDVALVRDWISAGAPKFPDDVTPPPADPAVKNAGSEYVLSKILTHVRTLSVEDRLFVRYFSTNHLLAAGASREELDLQRDAFAKAINHLSQEPRIVRPTVVDPPWETVFAVDIRQLGWHKQPLSRLRNGKPGALSPLTIYDLALLEYPYAIIDEESTTYAQVLEEYLGPGHFIRPIPYLRTDWFCSTATQPPLYEDFLQLPFEVAELEKQLGVDSANDLYTGRAKRAGMTVSGVSRNNRMVERHDAPHGAYWKSFDTATSKSRENLFLDPINVQPVGGEFIFNLPNGLQGYLLALANGRRIAAASTSIVTDSFADDKTVRNGLACMRCHDQGMKDFADNVRPAVERLPGSPGFNKRDVLALYPPQEEMDRLLEEDRSRFLGSLQKALGHPQTAEPLIPVSHRFLDEPLSLGAAAGELGLVRSDDLGVLFRSPQLVRFGLAALGSAGGVARRDMWEDSFHEVVKGLGLGIPVVPLDGLTRINFPPDEPAALNVQLATNRPGNVFAPGDELVLTVTNKSRSDLYIELIGTSEKGEKVILAPATTVVKGGQAFRFPENGGLKVQKGAEKEQITLFACDQAFPAGEVLRGYGTTDRFFHNFYRLRVVGGRPQLEFEPTKMLKRTLEIETK